jgi:hypothetical protein
MLWSIIHRNLIQQYVGLYNWNLNFNIIIKDSLFYYRTNFIPRLVSFSDITQMPAANGLWSSEFTLPQTHRIIHKK